MSRLASTRMISTVQAPDGTTRKDIDYKPHPIMSKDITDLLGETISIHYIGLLDYKCNPSANNYINTYIVSKHVKDEMVMEPRVLFSNIDMNLLDNPDYKDTVANTLLSKNNIEFSHADGYIGEIHPQSTLKPGSEQFSSEFYTYQISPKYALVYDGEKIEAVKEAQNQEQIVAQIEARLQELKNQEHEQKEQDEEQGEER